MCSLSYGQTWGSIQPIFTLATAKRYLLSCLRSHPNLPAGSQALHESWWIPKWRNEAVIIFSNSSIVCWVRRSRSRGQTVLHRHWGRSSPSRTEELDFVFDPTIEWPWCVFWVLLVSNEVSMFAEIRRLDFFWAKWILWSLISYQKKSLPWLSLKKPYGAVTRSLRLFHGWRTQHSKCPWTTTSESVAN